MAKFVNRAKMDTATTGTGTITLGSAVAGYQSFADAGVADTNTVRYVIEDGDNWEIGTGTYTASGTTLARSVESSSNADAALNLTGNALVFVTAAAADLDVLDGLTATTAELNYNDITTLGTSEASKAVTADANGNVILSEEVQATSYIETLVSLSGTTPTVDCDEGNSFTLTTSGNTTFTFDYSGVNLTTNDSYGFTLKVTAGGTHTLTWPASVDWPGGTAPDAPASGETDVFVFYTVDGGTNWYGFQAGDALA